ncbi:hypothetical protein Dda_9113 [Drechslerella dactyloides]|uniref:Uncharacterized protein n=1 Tax=Drechslerella dactyloides TaxID=74499 RepID=A0AAD6IS70_DREDA|nr:hypothetical protein Dda_9113 [Drechslerella dactyloides]
MELLGFMRRLGSQSDYFIGGPGHAQPPHDGQPDARPAGRLQTDRQLASTDSANEPRPGCVCRCARTQTPVPDSSRDVNTITTTSTNTNRSHPHLSPQLASHDPPTMARGRRDHPRARWLLPAALTLTAAVATAGVYFWKEMEDHEAATGFRSEDEETADEKRRSRGMAGRSFGEAATAAGAGISNRVNEIWKEFFQGNSGDESDAVSRSRGGGPSMSGAARPSSSGTSSSIARSTVARSVPTREVPPLGNSQQVDWEKKKIIALVISGNEELDESLLLSLPTPVDISRWILLIFVYAPPPPPSPSLVQLSPRPLPMHHRSPSPAMSYTSSKSFARTQPSPPEVSPETSPSLVPAMRTPLTSGRTSRATGVLVGEHDDEDDDADDDVDSALQLDDADVDHLTSTASLTSSRMRASSRKSKADRETTGYSSMSELDALTPSVSSNFTRRLGSFRRSSSRRTGSDSSDDASEQTSVENSVTLPGLVLKTFGRDFPHQQVMHYSTPTGVVHMLRHLGVSLVFLSESCASIPSADNGSYNTSSADESNKPLPGALPMSPPLHPATTASVGGGEIVGMLRDWVGDIILVLDEDEDDSAPIVPSAVSGGEDDYYDERRRRSAKGKERGGAPVSEATGRKRRWLKDKNIARGITICDRQGLKGIWRAKVEGTRS